MTKLKIISIAICCSVSALWSEAQCAEKFGRNEEQPAMNYQTALYPIEDEIRNY